MLLLLQLLRLAVSPHTSSSSSSSSSEEAPEGTSRLARSTAFCMRREKSLSLRWWPLNSDTQNGVLCSPYLEESERASDDVTIHPTDHRVPNSFDCKTVVPILWFSKSDMQWFQMHTINEQVRVRQLGHLQVHGHFCVLNRELFGWGSRHPKDYVATRYRP